MEAVAPRSRGIMGYIATGVAIYALLVAALFFVQRSLLYHPNQTVPDPAAFEVPEMAAVDIPVEGDLKLLAWWRAPQSDTRPVIIVFHGNAGHIGDRAHKIRDYLDAGYGVLLLSYRYNAGSGGSPSEANMFADARAGLGFLREQGVREDRIVAFGESLGTGVAVAMAAEQRIGALVLEAPYSSMSELAQHHYWYTPARWLVRDTLDSVSRIGRVSSPILVLHGERDRVIPIKFGRWLFDAAPEPKEAHYLPEAQHNDLIDFGMASIVIAFLDRHLR